MTDLQVKYQSLQEEQRKNREQEALKARELADKERATDVKEQEKDIKADLARLERRKQGLKEFETSMNIATNLVGTAVKVADTIWTDVNPVSLILKSVKG